MITLIETAVAAAMAFSAQASDFQTEALCLGANIYHEARGESARGQRAVAYVTLNRVASNRFPGSICGVVREDRGPAPHDCQFSWWCDGKSDKPENVEAYGLALTEALKAMTGVSENEIGKATHYYAPKKADPYWAPKLLHIAFIGDHRFMREITQ